MTTSTGAPKAASASVWYASGSAPGASTAAGAGAEPVSLTLDYGRAVAAGDPVVAEAWIDRATRTLVFAHARLITQNGDLVASGSAVFRRQAPAPVAA